MTIKSKAAKPDAGKKNGEKVLRCAICGDVIEDGWGNNPDPLVTKDGACCCDGCNAYVIKARIVVDKIFEEAANASKAR